MSLTFCQSDIFRTNTFDGEFPDTADGPYPDEKTIPESLLPTNEYVNLSDERKVHFYPGRSILIM